MAIDTTTPRSRRALLYGAVGGLAAVAAHAFGRPVPVRALDPNDVVLGALNTTDRKTEIHKTGSGFAFAGSTELNGDGLRGTSVSGYGVRGVSESATGVKGMSQTGEGVYGISGSGFGVSGFSYGSPGVHGASEGQPGVAGVSSRVGVLGSAIDFGGIGVVGEGAREGRGGRFSGERAQIRLEPSTATSHPNSGQAGDLFVDARKRVWFCKGRTTWVRLDR